jgi:hypothetical protein
MLTTQGLWMCADDRVGLALLILLGVPAGELQSATIARAPAVPAHAYSVPATDTSLPCRLSVADTSGWILTRVEGARLMMRLPPDVKEVPQGRRLFVGTTPADRASAAARFAGWDFVSDDGSLRFLLRRRPGPPGQVPPEESYKNFKECTLAIGGRRVIVVSYLQVTANPQEQRHATYVVTGSIPSSPDSASTTDFSVSADSWSSRQRGLAIVGTIQLAPD